MKLVLLSTILSLSIFNTVSAAELSGDSNDNALYCAEQAELAGIEDVGEQEEYIKECVDSFDAPENDSLPVDNE